MALTTRPPASQDTCDRTGAPAPTRWQRIQPAVVPAALLLVASVALHLRDPHGQGSWGFCPWLLLTGTYCPGCGGLRAVNDLTNGDVAAAVSSNLMVVAAVPLAAGLWLRNLSHRWRGLRRPLPPGRVNAAWAVGSLLLLAFWVLRNLPVDALSWMTP